MKLTKTISRSALLLGTIASTTMIAPPILAQDGQTATETITVTARRREETLQDVPLSVSAFSGEDLERIGAADIVAIAETTPNVTLEVSRGTSSTLSAFIRGVGQQDPVAGFEAGVGIYVDDVYLNRPQGAVLDLYDVERIEVLRGPQGTLYGRNTIGGAVKYVTRRLDADAPTLNARVNVGSFNQFDQLVSGSVPVTDTFRVGGAVARFTRDGFGENIYLGEDNYNKDLIGYRFSAEWEPTDNLFFRIAYDDVEDTSNPRGGHRLIPGAFSGAPVLDDVHDTRAGLDVVEQRVEADGISLTAEWTVNDTWTIRNVMADRSDRSVTPIDFDNLPTADVDVPAIYENEQFSNELQFLFQDGDLAGVFGFYYLDANALTVFDVLLDDLGTLIGSPGFNAQTFGEVDTETFSFFGNFTYDINDQWSATLGARFTYDERTSRVLRQTYLGGFSEFFDGAGVSVATTSDFEGTNDWTDISPTLSIAYDHDERNNFYFTFSQGFKGGGFDPRGVTTVAPDLDGDGIGLTTNGVADPDDEYEFLSFDPETVDSFEIGWKYTSPNYRHSLALFHMDYTDVQIPGSQGSGTNFIGITTNAGAATIQGIEYEGFWSIADDMARAGDNLSLTWAVGLLDGEYDEFERFNAGTGQIENIADQAVIQNTPDTTVSATLAYVTPFYNGDLAVSGTMSHRGDSSQFEFPFEELDQEAYTLFNASVVWDSADGHWQAGLHGRNLTDEEYKVAGYDFVNNDTLAPELGLEGTLIGYYGPPRTFTATLAYRY